MVGAILLVALSIAPGVSASNEVTAANPIRKVVSMLQLMQQRVTAEGVKEKELYERFMCYCQTSGGDLKKSIAAANTKMPALASEIEEGVAQQVQLKEDLKQHQADREAAKGAMAEGTAIRKKAAAEFAKEKGEMDANIDAITKAVAALTKGMAGGFLQTGAAQVLRRLLVMKEDMLDADRQDLLAFLSTSQSSKYTPMSGQVTGILKQMGDEMSKDLASMITEEESAIKVFKELMAAKTKEVAALTASIEAKLQRSGDLAVSIVQMQNDLTGTEQALMEDTKFMADMEKSCGSKTADWEEREKTRTQELLAIAETIKVLNDDDALELFKKTLPGASASLLQMEGGAARQRTRALALVRSLQHSSGTDRPQIDFIALAINGKKCGFAEVVKMIDELVATLKQEQTDDDNKRESCGIQLDATDDQKKSMERSIADLETAITQATDGVAMLADEMKALQDGMTALDKSVAEGTELRQSEHADFSDLMSSDSTAKDVLNFAKNRLNKFYNPKLYKSPAARELTEEQRITQNLGGSIEPTAAPGGIAGTGIGASFVQVAAHQAEAPPPAPETYGEYTKKTEENTGVIEMINLLIKELDKEMTEAETQEKDSQADYEKFMADSKEKRAQDSKSLMGKQAAKVDLEAELEARNESKVSTGKQLAATLQVIQSLHQECDWLLKYFDVRQEARASEIDSLGKAKAVLSGADYALLQTVAKKALRK